MSGLSALDASFIGTVLEGVFYGLYCVVFILYIRVHLSRKSVNRTFLIYPLSTLFVLCTTFFALDFTQQYLTILYNGQNGQAVWALNVSTSALLSFIDFISQGVLIYRCWVVWSHKLPVIVVPSILALIYLATSLSLVGELILLGAQNVQDTPSWFTPIGIVSFSLSLGVNATFTGLLVFKIAKTSLAFRHSLSERNTRGRNDLLPLMSMLVESGIVLFAGQLVWVISFGIVSNVFYLIGGPLTMLYGIVPTLIVVRVSMEVAGSQTSTVESKMRFASSDQGSATKISGNIPWDPRLSQTPLVYPDLERSGGTINLEEPLSVSKTQ